ncbi:MAG: hypothetical protein K8I02_10915, partial [Candidatus Methylomirabilis sp.]|nr:hypothetical protein [Deltaproteobacteria bacterium]
MRGVLLSLALALAAAAAFCAWFLLAPVDLSRFPSRDIYRPDPILYNTMRPGAEAEPRIGDFRRDLWDGAKPTFSLAINSKGVRSPEFAVPKPANVFRVLAVGDSTTFGWDVEASEMYTALLERRLGERFEGFSAPDGKPLKIEVIAAGVSGYSSRQGLAYFESYLKDWSPDFVLVQFGINDEASTYSQSNRLMRLFADGSIFRRDAAGGWRPILPGFFRMSNWQNADAFEAFAQALSPISGLLAANSVRAGKNQEGKQRVTSSDFEQNLEDLLAAAPGGILIGANIRGDAHRAALARAGEARGAEILRFPDEFERLQWHFRQAKRSAADRARYEEWLGVETMRRLPWLYAYADGAHPNAMGHRVMAEALGRSKALQQAIWGFLGSAALHLEPPPPEPWEREIEARLEPIRPVIDAGYWSEAERALQELVAEVPEAAEAHWLLAKAYEARGATSRAEQAYRRAVRFDLGGPWGSRAAEELPEVADANGFEGEEGVAW